jgi:hypothetical protein
MVSLRGETARKLVELFEDAMTWVMKFKNEKRIYRYHRLELEY